MVTRAATQDEFIEALNTTLLLEYNALDAYDEAIAQLKGEELVSQMRDFRSDHVRHIEELTDLVSRNGHEPHRHSGAKSMMTQGKVSMGGLGGDKAILKAMKTNEDDTVKAYDRLVNHDDKSQEAAEIVRRAHQDEQRHRAWMEEQADRL